MATLASTTPSAHVMCGSFPSLGSGYATGVASDLHGTDLRSLRAVMVDSYRRAHKLGRTILFNIGSVENSNVVPPRRIYSVPVIVRRVGKGPIVPFELDPD